MTEFCWIIVYPYPFTNRNVIGRQIHNRFRSTSFPVPLNSSSFSVGLSSDVSATHLLIPLIMRTHETVRSENKDFDHDINAITSFVKIEFRIQDWADLRIWTNPPSRSLRDWVYSRHAVCITSDPSSIPMKICPFPISFQKPASEHGFDNFWSSGRSANFLK